MTRLNNTKAARRCGGALAVIAAAALTACGGGGTDSGASAMATAGDAASAADADGVRTALAVTASDPSVVKLANGSVKGKVASSDRSFFGIPYAAPPVGPLRWKAPQPAANWTGVRDATAPGNRCPQAGSDSSGNPAVLGSEDCLLLNVTTPQPQSATAKLPVMVWIHGGTFLVGAGSDYDPQILAKKGNVIVVTINYRLGALGYLAHPSLTAESADNSGNYGLLDQQAALAWVKKNIASFGGDPAKVTVFGESAGGASTWANVISPTAAGLFQRAIPESGAYFNGIPRATAETSGQRLATAVNCSGTDATAASCLRGVSATALVNQGGGGFSSTYTWGPVTGGALLPKPFKEALTTGSYNKVGLMHGNTHDEFTLFTAIQFDLQGAALTPDSYSQVVNQQFGSAGASVLAQYPVANFSSADAAYSALGTDAYFACPARTTTRLATAKGSTVYAFEFNDPNAPLGQLAFLFPNGTAPFPLKAYHSSEVQYLFQAPSNTGFSSAQLALSNTMIQYWSSFAATGKPVGSASWTAYSASADNVMSLAPGATKTVTTFAADHQCGFWAGFGI